LDGRRIIGDIGGTNARFAIAEGGKYRELMHVEVGRFGSLHDALVCTENLIRVDDVMESPKLAE
jgi:glucokinase